MSNRNLYFAAVTACQTSALFGYSVGVISGVLVLPSFLKSFGLESLSPADSATSQAVTVTTWLIGALLGGPLAMPICSKLGRKPCLLFSAIFNIIGAAVQVFSFGNLSLFNVGRFLGGIGVGAGTLGSPIYISEISPASKRAMLMSGYGTVLLISALFGSWGPFLASSIFPATNALQWQLPVGAQFIPAAVLLLCWPGIPETPRHLALRGGHDDLRAAHTALMWLYRLPERDPVVHEALAELAVAKNSVVTPSSSPVSNKSQERTKSFISALREPSVRRRLHVGIGLMVAQNMVGINALNYYGPTIFMLAGFKTVHASLFLNCIFGMVKLSSAFAFQFAFVRIRGNRFWLKLGAAICGMSMAVLAFCLKQLTPAVERETFAATASQVTPYGVVAVLMVYTFSFAFGISLGPISWNICSEIFPPRINAQCCTLTSSTQWLFQIIVALFTPRLMHSIGWVTFAMYAGFGLVSFFWLSWIVPETRNVPLGERMDALFDRDLKVSAHLDGPSERSPLL